MGFLSRGPVDASCRLTLRCWRRPVRGGGCFGVPLAFARQVLVGASPFQLYQPEVSPGVAKCPQGAQLPTPLKADIS